MTLSGLSSLLFMLPTLWVMNQNYSNFMNLSDLMNPKLSNYIFREQVGLNVIFIVALVSQTVFWFFFTRKMTDKIAAPAKLLRNHIRLVTRGDFSLPPIRLREDDDFKDLVNSYNYLFKLLQVQYERELDDLKKLKTTTTNPVAIKILDQLIKERATRLNRPEDTSLNPANDEALAKPRDSRPAS